MTERQIPVSDLGRLHYIAAVEPDERLERYNAVIASIMSSVSSSRLQRSSILDLHHRLAKHLENEERPRANEELACTMVRDADIIRLHESFEDAED